MPIGTERIRVLYGILAKRKRAHFYTVARWVVGILFTIAVALLPLTDTLRFDFWHGHHKLLGQPAGLVEAAKAFAFPFLAVNILIVVVSRFLGRYLCGFVCPVGSLGRLNEWTRYQSKKHFGRYLGPAVVFVVCALLSAITFSFWVDWHVFPEGSALARTLAGIFLGGMTLGFFAIVHGLGLDFCRRWCPSGVYFAVLGHKTWNGVEFAHPENCTHCKACERVCPADLNPTRMAGGDYRPGTGFYSDGMSNFALCLRCGDCVIACEGATAKRTEDTPLRMGFLPAPAREYRDGVLPPEEEHERPRKKRGPEPVAPASAQPAASEDEEEWKRARA